MRAYFKQLYRAWFTDLIDELVDERMKAVKIAGGRCDNCRGFVDFWFWKCSNPLTWWIEATCKECKSKAENVWFNMPERRKGRARGSIDTP